MVAGFDKLDSVLSEEILNHKLKDRVRGTNLTPGPTQQLLLRLIIVQTFQNVSVNNERERRGPINAHHVNDSLAHRDTSLGANGFELGADGWRNAFKQHRVSFLLHMFWN